MFHKKNKRRKKRKKKKKKKKKHWSEQNSSHLIKLSAQHRQMPGTLFSERSESEGKREALKRNKRKGKFQKPEKSISNSKAELELTHSYKNATIRKKKRKKEKKRKKMVAPYKAIHKQQNQNPKKQPDQAKTKSIP